MNCETCGTKAKVVDTRMYHDPNEEFDYVQRRHRCAECNESFTTIEVRLEKWAEKTDAT